MREASRVPVAKFQLPDSAIDVDITINNLLPLRNTELLRTYAAIDTRLRDFIYIIKHWAKQRQIADAYKSTLSPYAWVLMAVFVAQRAGLVPVLQREEPLDVDCEVEAGGKPWRCAYSLDVDRFAEVAKACDISVGGLLTMFFDYYATRCGLLLHATHVPPRHKLRCCSTVAPPEPPLQQPFSIVSVRVCLGRL